MTGKVKVWQTSFIQQYRDNYYKVNHEMGIDQKVQSKMIVEENILGISHGQSRTHTACHAHVKFNDEDYFQTFNAGIKTWDTKSD